MKHPVLLTIDLDRDWPIELKGRMESISGARADLPDSPTVTATLRGTRWLLEKLEEEGIIATFYIEGIVLQKLSQIDPEIVSMLGKHEIGCHGYAHEDFSGEGTNFLPDQSNMEDVIYRATDLISQLVHKPTGFRAPYLRYPNELDSILQENGYVHTSSSTVKQAQILHPTKRGELISVPLSTGRDQKGAVISGYLWQLLEGKRNLSDYLYFIDTQRKNERIEYSMLALHPWHLYFRIKNKVYLKGEKLTTNLQNISELVKILSGDLISVATFLKERGYT